MAENNIDQLKYQFRQEMQRICDEYKKVYRKPSTRFLQMIDEHGAVEAARSVILRKSIPDCFTDLWLDNKPELTVEYIVVTRPEFHVLFGDYKNDIIKKARKRLGME